MKPGVAAYDFDYTIYNGDASADFIKYCLVHQPKLLVYVPILGLSLFSLVFKLKSRKAIKQSAFTFLKGVKDIDGVLEGFWVSHEHKIATWYHSQKTNTDIIISASPDFLLAPIAKKLGVKTLIATLMDSKTGKITGENCRAGEKLVRLDVYDASLVIERAYSDSLSDTPLLERAKQGFIVKHGNITPFEKRI